MKERTIDIPTADGRMDAFVTHPEEGGPFPAVIVLMDIWGLREELFDIARKIATVGYHCTVPNFWYRRGKVRYELRDENGRMRSINVIPKELQDEMHANMNQVTDRMAMADIGSALSFLEGEPVRKGPKGTIGYCIGGRLSLAAAAEFPDIFRASASLHGTSMVSDAADSPHRSIGKMRGEVYFGYGERDRFTPPAVRETLAKRMGENAEVRCRANVHPGADHGYALPDRDVFDKAAANRDWECIFAMYRRQLG
jgi:carboxymethylenebutenolidase